MLNSMKNTHKPYGDFAPRLGTEELEPLTWKERFWVTVIVVAIAIILVEVVTRISNLI